MKITCYWKTDHSTLTEIAGKAYDICFDICESMGYKEWKIFFKKTWNFDITTIEKIDFINQFVEGKLQEEKWQLKRDGYEVSGNLSKRTGFIFSLNLKLALKQTTRLSCSFGIHSPFLTNCCVITLPKTDFHYAAFFNSVVKTLNPQWATLTEDKLHVGIAEYAKDMIPGYHMYYSRHSHILL